MSDRLAKTFIHYVSQLSRQGPPFLSIEGLSIDLATGIKNLWLATLPPLLVGSTEPARFGSNALVSQTATSLRNTSSSGLCVILCQGFEPTDSQSIGQFKRITLTELITSADTLAFMASAVAPKLDPDGPIRHVRQSLCSVGAELRPGAEAVAQYFDDVASGVGIGDALPRLGAFCDSNEVEVMSSTRITENLRLARLVVDTEDYDTDRIRGRAKRILPQLDSSLDANTLIRWLELSDARVLSNLTFEQAREIFEERVEDFPATVRFFLIGFRDRDVGRFADGLELQLIDAALEDANRLRIGLERRLAAKNLLDYDAQNVRTVFDTPTRRRLEQFTRDRVIVSIADNLFGGLILALSELDSTCQSIEVSPKSIPANLPGSKSAARQQLTLALASFAIGPALRDCLPSTGMQVDSLLMTSPRQLLAQLGPLSFEELFSDRSLRRDDSNFSTLVLKIIGQSRQDALELRWTPSLDDLVQFATVFEFADRPCLQLSIEAVPLAAEFCNSTHRGRLPLVDSDSSLAERVCQIAGELIEHGLSRALLTSLLLAWSSHVTEAKVIRGDNIDAISLTGSIAGSAESVALSILSPLKAEWLLQREIQMNLILGDLPAVSGKPFTDDEPLARLIEAATALSRITASGTPPFLRISTTDRPLLPIAESATWSVYSTSYVAIDDFSAEAAIGKVIERLIKLQPEVAQHFKCVCVGPNAASIVVRQALRMLDREIGISRVGQIELWCVDERPSTETLLLADNDLVADEREKLRIRYFDTFPSLRKAFSDSGKGTLAHLCVVTGLSATSSRLNVSTANVPLPAISADVLFAPKTWLKPNAQRKLLLLPPVATSIGILWYRLTSVYEGESWSISSAFASAPEVQSSTKGLKDYLLLAHDVALWVATVDRYASRESLEWALGDDVAILHQEARLGNSSPLGLVISQKSGGTTDRAIARSLKHSGIVPVEARAVEIGKQLRVVASQGYGILALQAATSGSGINELVAHVVAFALLGTHASPWPLHPAAEFS